MNMIPKKTRISIMKLILVLTLLFALPITAYAETTASVLQTYVTEQTMTVFINSELLTNDLKCVVSNQNTEITTSGLLSDENILTRTTILVDISTSMPSATRDSVLTVLNQMVDDKAGNEEYRIIVFGDELNTLQDFTSDRYDLSNAVDKIVFNGTQSKIYDAIFNTIPRISRIEGKPTFCRTIVITDGVDDTVSGITKEELFIKLQSERYPVDVVAVSSKEAGENKELAAIVRMSNGRYNTLNPNTETAALADALITSNYFCFESIVPSALLDGTTRQVDISDGLSNISIDVKFPVFNAPVTTVQPSATAEPEETAVVTTEPTEVPVTPMPTLPPETITSKPVTGLFGEYTIVIFIGAGVALLIVLAIIIAVVVTRGKKNRMASRPASAVSKEHGADKYAEKTEFVGDMNNTDSQYTIKLSNANDPSKTWTLPVVGELLIGRSEHCPVQLHDKSVSREQCKIKVKENSLVVVHLGQTNKTSLNGSTVTGDAPLQSGDTLKFGRVVLRIDYIQTLGSPPIKEEPPQNQKRGNTESIF